jgi:putative Mn2+ efflux pump MntP
MVHSMAVYLITFVLGLTYFSSGLSNSRGGVPLKAGTPMKAAIAFAVFAFGLFAAGYFSAGLMTGRAADSGAWVSFIMLMFVGFRITLKAVRQKGVFKIFEIELPSVIFALAIALGINSLFVGVAVRFLGYPFGIASSMLALMVWLLSFSGLLYGNMFKPGTGRMLEIGGGVVMMLLAIMLYLGI